MPFIDDILEQRSVSIIGMSKNAGKTEALNYVLRRLARNDIRVAVTSIGVDGEQTDIVTGTSKPEITLCDGTMFGTAQKLYDAKRLSAEVLDVGGEITPLGRVVTAVARSDGKVMLACSGSTVGLKGWMERVAELGARLILVDGALSRKTFASPAVCESLILCTGAALSSDMDTLIRKTMHLITMIGLPLTSQSIADAFGDGGESRRGVWGIDGCGYMVCLSESSSLLMDSHDPEEYGGCRVVYVAGALTDRFLEIFTANAGLSETELVVEDFSKIFVSPFVYAKFLKAGGRISVLRRAKLIALCANPVSPNGTVMDSSVLCGRLSEATGIPVYDIFKL